MGDTWGNGGVVWGNGGVIWANGAVNDEEVRVERDGGLPSAFEWRGARYEVRDVIGRWRIEGRWWADGRDREYWRVEARGGAVWDLYFDRQRDVWHMERLWD